MSNFHAYADTSDHVEPASMRPALAAIAAALRGAIEAPVSGLRTIIERRVARQHIARLTDHMLRDFGFERDWDGTIYSIRTGEDGTP